MTERQEIDGKLDISVTLTLVGLLGAMWLFLHRTILELTVTAPADVSLLVFGYMHWFATVYLSLALYLVYRRALVAEKRGWTRSQRVAARVLFQTWPAVGVLIVISLIAAKVIPRSGDVVLQAIWIIVALIISVSAVLRTAKSERERENGALWFWLIAGVALIPFLMLMSVVHSDVQITTDQEFYRRSDEVLIDIRSAGYVFRPYVSELRFGAVRRRVIGDETVVIKPQQHGGDDLIQVDFTSQVIPIRRTAFHEIKMEGR